MINLNKYFNLIVLLRVKVPLSLNRPEYQIKSILKKTLVKMLKDNKDTSKIFRAFLNSYQQSLLGNQNAETFSTQEHEALNAFRGKLLNSI